MTDLSIIIVSYKGWKRLTSCLESLNSFTGLNFSTEVIIVDNRSDDNTITEIETRFPKFRFIYNKINGGFANGCNLGSSNATGEFLLFLNPDTVAAESEIGKLLNIAKQNSDYTILSCRQVNEKGRESIASGSFPQFHNLTGFQRALSGRLTPYAAPDSYRDRTSDISFPDWVSGSVIMIRKEKFQNLGGFDEDFWMYFEDVDLCMRVRKSGGEIALSREINIEHNHGGSSRINIKTASLTKSEVLISKHIYFSKHKSGIERVLIQMFLIINNFISCGIMAVFGVLFFFVPKVFARTLIFLRLLKYYTGSILRLSWISPRSVNFKKR